ncbi:MAG: alpha/beta fold hydrolase [Acidimicrobiales bacterium]
MTEPVDHALPPMPTAVAAWQAEGETVDVGGQEIFVVDSGSGSGAGSGATAMDEPVLVLLHGFPGSSFDWHHIVPALVGEWRVLTFDFLGFGLSAKPRDVRYSLFAQADLAERLLADRGVTKATLVAHDMGDTVAAELLIRGAEGRAGVGWDGCVLTNGSIFIDQAQLTAGQQALLALPDEPLAEPLGAEGLRAGMAASFPPGRPSSGELDAMVWLNQLAGGDLLLPRLIRYIEERRQHQPRWTAALRDYPGPLVAAWGDLDPIAVPAMADRLGGLRDETGNPVEVIHWPDVGHWPSVETPDLVAGLITDCANRW